MAYRAKAAGLRDIELKKAVKQIEGGQDPEQVMVRFANALTNKLIHTPSIELKKASALGRKDLLEWAQALFDLSEDNDNSNG